MVISKGKDEPIQIMKLKEAPNVKRVANVSVTLISPMEINPVFRTYDVLKTSIDLA